MTDILSTYFSNVVAGDLFNLVTSSKLGQGVARQVYRSALVPEHVIKFEVTGGSFQNILEWEAWDAVRHTKYAKWFCPCVSISNCGTILIQKFAKNIEREQLPEQVPAFFTDLSPENWGLLDGQPVCRDYGRSLLMDRGLTNKLRKAEWF